MPKQLGVFPSRIYRQWFELYPDSPQADGWLETAARLEEIQPSLPGAGTCDNNPHRHKMGVECTKTGYALPDVLSVDWLALTIPTETKEQQVRVLAMLGALFPLVDTDYGGNGYIRGASFLEGGRVLWHPEQLSMGVHLRMPSKCLSVVAELLPDHGPMALLKRFAETWSATVTRIDLAIDSDKDLVGEALSHLRAGSVTTRARSYEERKPMQITGERKGHGLNIGSRSSETFVRIYHKGLEQGLGEEVNWFRCEFEFKSDRAHAIAEMLLAGDFEGVRGAMLSHLDFKTSAADSNKRRWLSAPWWLALLDNVSKKALRLTKPIEASIDRLGQWLARQCGPSLFVWQKHCEQLGVDFEAWVRRFEPRCEDNARLKLILQTV